MHWLFSFGWWLLPMYLLCGLVVVAVMVFWEDPDDDQDHIVVAAVLFWPLALCLVVLRVVAMGAVKLGRAVRRGR